MDLPGLNATTVTMSIYYHFLAKEGIFGEALCENVLKYVPHRQWIFSIPKRLRIYFMFDHKLLSKLSQCVWKVLGVNLKRAVCRNDHPHPPERMPRRKLCASITWILRFLLLMII